MRNIFALVFVTSGLAAVTYSLPVENSLPGLHKCKCNSYTAECLVRGIESMKPYLEKGIPEALVPSFEPYCVEKSYGLILKDIKNLVLADISLRGLTKFTISNAKFLESPHRLKFKMHFPYINMSAIGFLNVKRLNDTLTGRKMEHEFGNITLNVRVRGFPIKYTLYEEIRRHFYVSNIHLRLKIMDTRAILNYFNIGSNIRALSVNIFHYMVNRPLLPTRTVKSTILSDAAEIIQSTANNLFQKYPIHTLCVT